ncbi:MAG: AmmeMemoRadiSam system protein B [Desulfobacterales bacterium]|nr:AmmeMemoRadiSam system protein B [Desulfobacterales bacterium]
MNLRKAAFAGSWYPADAKACERAITGFMEEFDGLGHDGREFMGSIVPHAGWYFSGGIACNAIARLQGPTPTDVVVVFGMHLHPRSPNFIMADGAWETPFGNMPVAQDLAQALSRRFRFTQETPVDFTRDNTIELQLPFVKYFFPQAKVLTLGLPPAAASLDIGRAVVAEALEKGLRIKVVGSTDLTHYGPNYGFAPQGSGAKALAWVRDENDRRVIDAMLALDGAGVIREGVASQSACCAGAAAGAISAVREIGAANGEILAYATSHDKSPGDSFVGYVGVLFS